MARGDTSSVGDDRLLDDEFRRRAVRSVRSIGDVLRATYGPYAREKLLVDHVGTGYVTNQGSKILEELHVDDPVAQMVVDAFDFSETYADGTTFAVLFAAELLGEAEALIEEGVSPVDVVRGFEAATGVAADGMAGIAVPLELNDLEQTALVTTATAAKGGFHEDQIEHLRRVVLDTGSVLEPSVSLDDVRFEEEIRLDVESSRVVQGTVLKSDPAREDMPRDVVDADVLLISEAVSEPDPEDLLEDTALTFSGPEAVAGAVNWSEQWIEGRTRAIIDSGADVVVCEGRLENTVVSALAKAGVLAFHELTEEKFERVHLAVGGTTAPADRIEDATLGYAGRITITDIGAGKIKGIVIADCPETATATVVLNAGTTSGAGLAKRILKQGIGTLAAAYDDPRAIPGGGAVEIAAARAVRRGVPDIEGPAQLAAGAYADALEATVAQLVRNAGKDPLDQVPALKRAHADGADDATIDLDTGELTSAYEVGIIEPFAIKRHALTTASEFANSLLRIDALLPAGDGESPEIADLDKASPTPSGTWGK